MTASQATDPSRNVSHQSSCTNGMAKEQIECTESSEAVRRTIGDESSRTCLLIWATSGAHSGEKYQLCSVSSEENLPTVLNGDREWIIGRRANCHIRLRYDLEVSGVHARIHLDDTGAVLTVKDMNSTNGTLVNGEKVANDEDTIVVDDSVVTVGKTSLKVAWCDHTECLLTSSDTFTPFHRNADKSADVKQQSTEGNPLESDASVDVAAAASSRYIPLNTSAPASVTSTSAITESVDHTVDTNDNDDFEEQPAPEPSALGTGDMSTSHCFICGVFIGSLDFLAQQTHLNNCLDNPPQHNSMSARRTSQTATKAGRTRKRGRDSSGLQIALALSRSMQSEEQQVDTDIAMVSSEIEDVDEEIAKLQAKKSKLIAKKERLRRKQKRVDTSSTVLKPMDALEQIDLATALSTIFPQTQKVCRSSSASRINRGWMWDAAKQSRGECEFYSNGVLGTLLDTVDKSKSGIYERL